MNTVISYHDDRQRVLDATDIVALIGDNVTLRPKGREFVCLCPFHDDHSPSMYVVPHKQIFHCFVCGAGGNAFDFVMKYHAMGFREALTMLAERAGVPLSAPQTRDAPRHDSDVSREDIARANAFALNFFKALLAHPQHGEPGRQVVARRGIAPEMVEAFNIGLSPDRWDGLLQTIQSKKLDLEPFIAAGLIKKRPERDGHYDALRNRLIFPIADQAGRTIAFGGRIIDPQDEPKYLNSPETALFQKGSTLFGLGLAFRSIQEHKRAIVTEGYTDVIACHQAGFTNVVATLGTALTERHAAILRRLCDEVVVLFDGDEAGARAAERAFEVFFKEPVDVKVAPLPDKLDPADLLASENGAERFRAVIDSAQDILSFRLDRLAAGLDAQGRAPGSAGRTRAVEDTLARLIELGLAHLPVIRRRIIVKRLARIGGVDEPTILEAIEEARRKAARRTAAANPGASSAPRRPETPAEHALACLLAAPEMAAKFPDSARDILDPQAYGCSLARTVAQTLALSAKRDGEVSLSAALMDLSDPDARSLATAFATEAGQITEQDPDKLEQRFHGCVQRFRKVSSFSGSSSGIDRILEVREAHRTLGGNPVSVPKPSV